MKIVIISLTSMHTEPYYRAVWSLVWIDGYFEFNPIALTKAKTVHNFGLSECNRVNGTLKQYFSLSPAISQRTTDKRKKKGSASTRKDRDEYTMKQSLLTLILFSC